ncbi:hypothetical protein ACT3SZ_11800 [Corynebacterium sp. AOP40-9SA-29]|uniref:hypothetical protein n=1 Tax=Corynebacterium sp. AOP40-9SA-29 TaxID=3457677 RepID=UPI0040334846
MNGVEQPDQPITPMTWARLFGVLLRNPPSTLHATVESRGEFAEKSAYEIWRDGPKLRVEKNGAPTFISDGETYWSFGRTERLAGAQGRPVAAAGDGSRFFGGIQHLCRPWKAGDWAGTDATAPDSPAAEDSFQGRDCWTIVLNEELRIWVDRDSGFLLGMIADTTDPTIDGQWIKAPEIGISLDAALFSWDGPVLTQGDVKKLRSDEIRALEESQMAWFRGNVLSTPLTASATVSLIPEQMRVEEDIVHGGTPGIFRFERRVSTPDRANPQPAGKKADVSWQEDGYDWEVTFLAPQIIVDDALRSEVRRRFSRQVHDRSEEK